MVSFDEVIKLIAENGPALDDRRLQIYVHVPYCTSKCHFCDYVIGNDTKQLTASHAHHDDYVDVLTRQIRGMGPVLGDLGYRPTSIYWGGGTPTRLSPSNLQRIGEALSDSFDLAAIESHSMEVSPETFTEDHIHALLPVRLDRISIGVQSFDPDALKRAGRAHSADQAVGAVETARRGGIENVNIDLISGFPGERIDEIEASARQAAALGVQHISVYSYRPSPGTRMRQHIETGRRESADLDHMKSSYLAARTALEEVGFHEYALAYFAREPRHHSKVSRHIYNLEGDIIGFGSGAQSVLGWHRIINDNGQFNRYMSDPMSFDSCAKFSTEPSKIESLMIRLGAALQTFDGVNFQRFKAITGHSLQDLRRSNVTVRNFLDHLMRCGGQFSETEERLALAKDDLYAVYLEHLDKLVRLDLLDSGLRA